MGDRVLESKPKTIPDMSDEEWNEYEASLKANKKSFTSLQVYPIFQLLFFIIMANNVSADFKSVWSRKYQKTFNKENVARQICDTTAESDLSSGQTLVRNYAVQP